MSYWSVVQTESQRESTAAKFLKEAAFEVSLPRIAIKSPVRERVAPLFPGYVFVSIVDGQWWEARWAIGVVRVLMTDGVPARVPERVMREIRRREDGSGLVRLPGMARGTAVRITRGSFMGKVGLDDGLSGGGRVRVLLELLGRSVPVSIAGADIVAAAETLASDS